MVATEDNQEAMGENVELEDSEREEALSFCDLPINDGADDLSKDDDRRRPSSDHDFFEFFSDLSSEMCPAEDIILCGKLVPYKEKESPSTNRTHDEDHSQDLTKKSFFRRRSESLNELQSSRSRGKGQLMRNSHSLDYRKLQRDSSSKSTSPAKDRNPSDKCFGKCDFSVQKSSYSSPPAKPRWHLFVFGSVKVPRVMELKDIRNRQSRRIPASMFPAFGGPDTVSFRRDEAKGFWRMLRALSCKGQASAAVTASVSCIPHTRVARV